MQLNEVVEDNKNGYKRPYAMHMKLFFKCINGHYVVGYTSLYIILHYSIYIGFWKPMIKYTQI